MAQGSKLSGTTRGRHSGGRRAAMLTGWLLAGSMLTGQAHARPTIAVLTSDDLPEYQEPIETFREGVNAPIQVFQLQGDKDRAIRITEQLRDDPPLLVFALGAKAAWVAERQLTGVPIVYAQVRDPKRYGIDGAFTTGVAMEVPGEMTLTQLRLFAPEVRRIGIIVSTDSPRTQLEPLEAAAKAADYELVIRRVADSKDVRRTFNAMRGDIDGLWLIPDPVVTTPANFHYMRHEAVRMRMPVIAWSKALVEAGALLSVTPDHATTGTQAAEIAMEVLEGRTAGTIPPVAPRMPRVVLNRDTEAAIGLRLDPMLLDFVDEVVAAPTER